MHASTSSGRQAELLKKLLEIRKLKKEEQELKAEVREELAIKKQDQRLKELEQQLAQATLNAKALDQQLCYGAPDWSGAGELWSGWQAGTEVTYTANASHGAAPPADIVSCTAGTMKLQIYKKPFAQGGLRQAFYARDAAGQRFVVKRALQESSKHKRNLKEAHAHAHAAAISLLAAEQFQRSIKGAGQPGLSLKSFGYVSVSVVVLEDKEAPSGKAVLLKEPMLEPKAGCKWVKWTVNDGQVLDDGKADDVVQAFSHYSLRFGREQLGYDMLVLDVQGLVKTDPGGGKSYTLTDPALCSSDKKHGPTDLGKPALDTFFGCHTCGPGCNALGCQRLRPAGEVGSTSQ
ncbi:hypothetical protein N2152v2_002260 [Parachlorella kessleri]